MLGRGKGVEATRAKGDGFIFGGKGVEALFKHFASYLRSCFTKI